MSDYTTFYELKINVDYDYQPEEKQVLWPNDEAYPGCPASVKVNAVYVGLKDIYEDLDFIDIVKLEEEIYDSINKGDF